ncbi:MAG: GNAT family N-acetyltransferase [Streptococcus sp.]|uniref:GNAT family N-acetyltransferase n=1 Tax=Streptococcus sp. TaxID=1306 RepID=UPI0039966C79
MIYLTVKGLMKMSRILPAGYEIRMIDERIYHMAGKEEWSSDLCSQFPTFADYRERGIGTAVLFDGTLAAGASSYTVYQGGIEIRDRYKGGTPPPGTCQGMRRQAILECLDRGLYPAWDAHNKASLALALKLGYHFDKEYGHLKSVNRTVDGCSIIIFKKKH